MAAKKFNFQFEDIRRNETPVVASGFGDMVEDPDDPEEGFVEVDLTEDDPDKAVTVASDASGGSSNGADPDADSQREARREELRRKKAAREGADEAINEARVEVAAELNTLHDKIDALESQKGLTKLEEDYEEEKAAIETKMEEAMENGKSEEFAKLNSQLIELNGAMSEKRMELKKPTADAPADLDTGDPAGQQPANPRAVAFIKANEDWWVDPDNEDAVDYARRLDKKLVGMGYDPRSDRYWSAFNKNFDKKFDGLRVESDEDLDLDLDTAPRARAKSPVTRPGAGSGSGGAAPRGGDAGGDGGGEGAGNSKVRLTAADKANMARFSLDPSNPEHCRQYAMNKVPEART